jgi:hypothetical protein
MKKTIADVESELGWYVDQAAHSDKAAALAGMAMLHAVRDFDRTSERLTMRMIWLTVAIAFLTVFQIVIALVPLLY